MPLTHSVKEMVLKNGARGLVILVPGVASVHYEVQFRAGNNYVRRPEISQVAHIMEHMAFGATEEFPTVGAFSQEFSKNGAYSNAYTDSLNLNYEAHAGILEWERIMNLERLCITHPIYTQQLLDAEKGNVREELTGYLGDDSRVLWQNIMRSTGLKRWYDPRELKTIDATTLDDIKEHYHRTHTTNNMRFIIAGDLEEHLPALIEQFEGWQLPKGELLSIEQETAHAGGLVYVRRRAARSLTFSLQFFLNRTLNRRELRAMNMLTHILTSTYHSRIFGVARTRGICYEMGSWGSCEPTGTSEFGVGGEVSFKNAHELFVLIIEQLKIVSTEGVTEKELEEGKQYRLGSLQMDLESARSLASWYSDIYYDTGKIDYVESMPDLINGTTVEEMKLLAKEFIDGGIWVFGGLGDISKEVLQEHYDLFAKELIEG